MHPGDHQSDLRLVISGDCVLLEQAPDTGVPTPVPARRRALTVTAAAAGVLPLAVHLFFALRGYFAHDDFLLSYLAVRDPAAMWHGYNGHLLPGVFVLAWLSSTLAPLNFPVLMAPILIMQALASVLLWRVLVRLFGRRWAIVPPFAVFTCSPLILTTTLWWSYAAQLVPLLVAMLGAVLAHVCFLDRPRRRYAVLALLCTVAGLAFFEKAALIPMLLAGVTALHAPHALRRLWRWWLGYAAVLLCYLLGYLALVDNPAQPSAPGVLELARRMVLDTLATTSLGLPVTGAPGTPQVFAGLPVLLVAGTLVLSLVAAALVIGRRRALLALSLLGGYLAVDITLVALARLPMIGPGVGSDMRYIADAVPVAVLSFAFAFLAPQRKTPRPARLIAVLLTVAMAVGATVSQVRLAPNLSYAAARSYVDTALATTRQDMVLYDVQVPNDVMLSWFGAQGRSSRVLSPAPGAPRFDVPAETIYLLDHTGRPQEITGLVNTTLAWRPPDATCGYPVNQPLTIIPLTGVVRGKRLIRLEYFTAATGPVIINAGAQSFTVVLQEGVHYLNVPVDGEFSRIDLRRTTAVTTACFTGVVIGEPVEQ